MVVHETQRSKRAVGPFCPALVHWWIINCALLALHVTLVPSFSLYEPGTMLTVSPAVIL